MNPQIERAILDDPAAISKIKRAILARSQGPTTREAASFVDWERLAEELGQPFDAELIPLSKLRQMRRDPMIGFGLHYIKTPLVRASWRIDATGQDGGDNEELALQVAAFVDAALRPIYARLLFQLTLSLDFGFQAIAKQFQLDQPKATYRSPSGEMLPVWSEGNVDAVVWKSFVPMPPERVRPAWDEKTREFNGIIYEGDEAENQTGGGLGAALRRSAGGAGAGQEEAPTVDLYHSLWATNEKDSVFSSLYGYPRIGYAYRYWWSYWYRWTLSDRAFERYALPPMVGRHPAGEFEDEEGIRYDYLDVILDAMEQIRAGSIAGIPSDPHVDDMGNATNVPQWDIAYVQGGDAKWDFDRSFNYLDVLKLRSVWVPEQAFIEGEGGTSSRNVAAQMAEIFVQSQHNLMQEIDDQINRYLIPHLVLINFPEYAGKVTKVTTGFSSDDVDFMKQIIQLIGQTDPFALGVDVRAVMARAGVPMLTPEQMAEERAQLQAGSAATAPALAEPGPGEVGVVEDAASATGFSYVKGRERVILLSDDADWIPDSEHFESRQAKAYARQAQATWAQYAHALYADFANHLQDYLSGPVELADAEDGKAEEAIAAGVAAAAAEALAEEAVSKWTIPSRAVAAAARRMGAIIRRVLKLGADIEGDRAGVPERPSDEERDEWTDERLGWLLTQREATVRRELTEWLAGELERGGTPREIADRMREHFDDFPRWTGERVARTEVQTAYNVGTIMAARSGGYEQVQAHDASDGTDRTTDEPCKERHGKIFGIPDALRENEDEHPNGTLYFTIVPKKDGVEVVEVEAADPMDERIRAVYDAGEGAVYFSAGLTWDEKSEYLRALVESLR